MKEYKTPPKVLYCVAGFKFNTNDDNFRIAEQEDTGIYCYNGFCEMDNRHATVEFMYNFAIVTKSKDAMYCKLKNKRSLIPKGALELLFEDGVQE